MNAGLLALLMAQNNLRHTQQMLASQDVDIDINNKKKKTIKKEYEPRHKEKFYEPKHNKHERIVSI